MRLVVASDCKLKYMELLMQMSTPSAIRSCSTFGHLFKKSVVPQDASALERQLKRAAQRRSLDDVSKTVFQWRIKMLLLNWTNIGNIVQESTPGTSRLFHSHLKKFLFISKTSIRKVLDVPLYNYVPFPYSTIQVFQTIELGLFAYSDILIMSTQCSINYAPSFWWG